MKCDLADIGSQMQSHFRVCWPCLYHALKADALIAPSAVKHFAMMSYQLNIQIP